MTQSNTLMTPPELAKILDASFDESELRDLCFELKVDYENLAGGKKSDKARELVMRMKRHGRFLQLCARVKELRPKAINIQSFGELVVNSLGHDDPRVDEIQKLLTKLHEYFEQLSEWKELHNHLDETLNNFEQFAALVESHAKRNAAMDVVLLNRYWQPVSRRVERFLIWSKQIKYIGDPFQEFDSGESQGEGWAVSIHVLRQAINALVQDCPAIGEVTFFNKFRRKGKWKKWWRDLQNITHEFDNTLKNHMFIADKELRKTASNLLDLSKLI